MVMLKERIKNEFIPAVNTLCPGASTSGQIGALTDFAYNLGVGKLRMSTLRKRVNASDWRAVAIELRKWVMGGGKRLRGLTLRREAEIELI